MKKLYAVLLCGAMVFNMAGSSGISYANTVSAAVMPTVTKEVTATSASKESSSANLEKVLKVVKGKISIPAEYKEFNYHYYDGNYGDGVSWNFNWVKPSDSSNIQIQSDGSGNISYYSHIDNSKENGSIPVYLKKELQENAVKFVKEIAPTVGDKLKFVSSTFVGIYNGAYSYNFIRIESGIDFPDDTVNVWVDGITGEVKRVNIQWTYDTIIPSSKTQLSKDEATTILKNNMKMNLVYRMNYSTIYKNNVITNEKKAFLVYEPDQSYISVDAKSEKVYLTRSEWIEAKTTSDSVMNKESAAVSYDNGMASLTKQEMEKITELEKLITKQKAIDIITDNKSLYIDKNLITYSANLNKSSSGNYEWNVTLADSRPIDYTKEGNQYRAYAYGTVDAKTGKILGFNASLKSNFDDSTGKWKSVKVKYGKDEAKKILETFLKAQIKDRYNKSKFVNQNDGYVAFYKEETPIYGGYTYQYNRYNEGVEFSYNGIHGSVDGVTGKIYNYSCNWDDDIIFESTKGVISPEKAFDYYISKDGYQLIYEVNEINKYDPNYVGKDKYYDSSEAYSFTKEVRLVYRPDINPRFISPFTGNQLNNDGTVYTGKQPLSYSDIVETNESRNILLLADMNIGFEGGKFESNKSITIGELKSLMNQIGYGYYDDDKSLDNHLISREELAYDFIKRLGLEKAAKLKGIYQTNFIDQNKIKAEYDGAVALAKGFGLLVTEADNYLNPQAYITRGQFVKLLMKFIEIQKSES